MDRARLNRSYRSMAIIHSHFMDKGSQVIVDSEGNAFLQILNKDAI
jgi:hypothetical protein